MVYSPGLKSVYSSVGPATTSLDHAQGRDRVLVAHGSAEPREADVGKLEDFGRGLVLAYVEGRPGPPHRVDTRNGPGGDLLARRRP